MQKIYVYKVDGKVSICDNYKAYLEDTAGKEVILSTTIPYQEDEDHLNYQEAIEMAKGIRDNFISMELYLPEEYLEKYENPRVKTIAFVASRVYVDKADYAISIYEAGELLHFEGKKIKLDITKTSDAECVGISRILAYCVGHKIEEITIVVSSLVAAHYCFGVRRPDASERIARCLVASYHKASEHTKVTFVWDSKFASASNQTGNPLELGEYCANGLCKYVHNYREVTSDNESDQALVCSKLPELKHVWNKVLEKNDSSFEDNGFSEEEKYIFDEQKVSEQIKQENQFREVIISTSDKNNTLALEILLHCMKYSEDRDWAAYNVVTAYTYLLQFAYDKDALIERTIGEMLENEGIDQDVEMYLNQFSPDACGLTKHIYCLMMDEQMKQDYKAEYESYDLLYLPDSPLKTKLETKFKGIVDEMQLRCRNFFAERKTYRKLDKLKDTECLVKWIQKGGHSIEDLYWELMTNPVYYDTLHDVCQGYWENPDLAIKDEDEEQENVTLPSLVKKTVELRNQLQEKIFGQDMAIEKLVNSYFDGEKNAATDKQRKGPRNTILFAGPPGVGKTYTAETFAEHVGLPYRRFDMSTYAHDEDVVELVGCSSLWKNAKKGVLTSFVKENPKCVLLFDEIEKANLTVIHLFLQILDAGICFDRYDDRNVSFSEATVIFTTNAGKGLYEDAYNENLTALSNKVVIDALTKDVNVRTGVPFFPAAIASRFLSNTIVMFNHLSAPQIQKVLNADIEKALKEMKESYGISIEFDTRLATTVMYEMGGKSDARTASKSFGKFLNAQLLEYLILMQEKKGSSEMDKYTQISWNFHFDDAPKDVLNLYEGEKYGTILMFGEYELSEDERMKNNHVAVKQTTSVKEFKHVLRNEKVLFTVVDFNRGVTKEQRNKHLKVLDIDCDGRELLQHMEENYKEIAVYLNEAKENQYTSEEKRTLNFAGVSGYVSFASNAEKNTDVLVSLYHDFSFQSKIEEVALKHQVLEFNTRQLVFPEEKRAEIEFFDFTLTTAVEAEDKESILSCDMSPNVHWEDLRVDMDVKNELNTFIDYLKNPDEYENKGIRSAKGVLLYGNPGTGKTSLAKVVATESGINFLATSADKLLSQGADGVHEIFRIARKYAPAVLFIDEIEVIGANRSRTGPNYILNALLTEMDGFSTDRKKTVFVMAATNLYDIIDPALDRRFDRKIHIKLPDEESRIWLIKRIISREPEMFAVTDGKIDNIAKRAAYLSPADIESFIQAALREAIRQNCKVTDEILDECFEKTRNGDVNKKTSDDDLLRTARHEIGHVINTLENGEKSVYVSIIGREDANGYAQRAERKSSHLTKNEVLNQICICMGGRAAEQVYYEAEGISAGASADLQAATYYAKQMVCSWGMYEDEIGLGVISEEEYRYNKDAQLLVNQILSKELKRATNIICEKRDLCDRMVEALMNSKGKYLTEKEISKLYENRI